MSASPRYQPRAILMPGVFEKLHIRLLDNYGLQVDLDPPAMSMPQHLLRANKQWLERRLRALGLLAGVNDAESMRQLRAQVDVA